jgi:hypothetical protein
MNNVNSKFIALYNSIKATGLELNENQFKGLVLSRAKLTPSALLSDFYSKAKAEQLKKEQSKEIAQNPGQPVVHIKALLRAQANILPATVKAAFYDLPANVAELKQVDGLTITDGELISK